MNARLQLTTLSLLLILAGGCSVPPRPLPQTESPATQRNPSAVARKAATAPHKRSSADVRKRDERRRFLEQEIENCRGELQGLHQCGNAFDGIQNRLHDIDAALEGKLADPIEAAALIARRNEIVATTERIRKEEERLLPKLERLKQLEAELAGLLIKTAK